MRHTDLNPHTIIKLCLNHDHIFQQHLLAHYKLIQNIIIMVAMHDIELILSVSLLIDQHQIYLYFLRLLNQFRYISNRLIQSIVLLAIIIFFLATDQHQMSYKVGTVSLFLLILKQIIFLADIQSFVHLVQKINQYP